MLLWFAGLSVVLVWQVFRDPAIDYRLVIAGALLPDAIDAVAGRPAVAHTLVASVALLVVVMLATRGRRHLRRRLLAVPIGTFVHLVLDGMWTRTETFWWPLFGADFEGDGLPPFTRPLGVVLVQEILGLVALVWCWRQFALGDADRRARFLATGRLVRQPAA